MKATSGDRAPRDRRQLFAGGPDAPPWRRVAGVVAAMLLLAAASLALLAGVGLLGLQFVSQLFNSTGSQQPQDTTPSESPASTASPEPTPEGSKTPTSRAGSRVPIVAAGDFDPPPGNGEEHPEEVEFAYDGNPTTSWTTMSYRGNPSLGLIKPGVGIWFDLGRPQRLASVQLTLLGTGTDLELRAALETATDVPDLADEWQTIASARTAGGSVRLEPEESTTTRFLLVWMTKLPPEGDQSYRGGIEQAVIHRR